ncbi:MAG: ATP-binding protein, partial [Pseudomonadota bacterium]
QLKQEIEERKRMEEALQESFEKMKLFAYSVSHDLKNPAIGVYGLTKLLHKHYGDILEEKGKNYCDQILKASEQIAALAEKINLYIATKEAPLTIEEVKLREVIQMVRDEFSSQLNIRQVRWSEPEYLPEIRVDRVSILRVFRNLVDNALKYGGDDLGEIKIGHKESDEFHILSVRDDGVGIKQEASKKIFGLFKRYDTSRGIEGTGLGLAIVKEIAEQHRGQVWAEPELRKGITFYISISKYL